MPLQKILFKPGVNKENTRYTNEGGWYDCDKIRFRQGTPEKVGGWQQISSYTYSGTCRSLWSWSSLSGILYVGVGTNDKFYIERGGAYNDITPIRAVQVGLNGPFAATAGSTTVTVTDASHGATDGDFVTFFGALALSQQTFTVTIANPAVVTPATYVPANGTAVILSTTGALPTGLTAGVQYYVVGATGSTFNLANVPNGATITTSGTQSGTHSVYVNSGLTAAVLNQSFAITTIDSNSYTITVPVAAGVYDTGNGGNPVSAYYGLHIGSDTAQPFTGWGAGPWGYGAWGYGQPGVSSLRLWWQNNFGQDLVFGYRGSPMYYWNASVGATPNPVTITIAAPGVLTLTNGSLIDGQAIILLTSGALPTGLTSGTVYYVGNVSGATFRLATTFANYLAGTYITTTGTQSGTHYVSPYGIPVTSLGGASDVPAYVNFVMVSDASRFTIAFGCSAYGSADTTIDPMLIRWSDQESVTNWTPAVTNQAGFIRLSHGSEILTAVQARQEIVVFTDTSVYSMQYLGPPYIWSTQLLGDNISVAGYNTAIIASGIVYWMGVDKFYKYDGRVQTLRCDLRQFIYSDINLEQQEQFFAGTNEGFNEVWWFYCTANSTTIDRYVVYNYAEDIWYYGSMGRTAWLDSGLVKYPLAATYSNNLVYHEYGIDDNTTDTTQPIEAYITSSQFDIGDGHNFGFVWRIVPDLTFRGSSTTGTTPQVTMYLLPLQNSGSGYNDPVESGDQSVGGVSYANVARVGTYTVDQFTGQVYTRVRGRQMAMKISSNQIGTMWQLGAPRIDIRPDGRRGA
jgi:hypothetical protein